MDKFYVTFGQRSPAKNGYIEVYAKDDKQAKEKVESAYGLDWAFIYDKKQFNRKLYPVGKLGELK